jgi:hypothetical protein
MVIIGLSLKPHPERYFAKTSHGYYVSSQKFDNETKTHRGGALTKEQRQRADTFRHACAPAYAIGQGDRKAFLSITAPRRVLLSVRISA